MLGQGEVFLWKSHPVLAGKKTVSKGDLFYLHGTSAVTVTADPTQLQIH